MRETYEIHLTEHHYSEEIYTIEQIKNLLLPVFENYNVNSATLFGSYAKGLACERSDVDILVDSGLRGIRFFGLLDDVVTALNKPVDLIDVIEVRKNSEIEQDIKRTGVLIYERA
ncbi:MAG: nucleotidyltransferase domain-containing protein [Ruminococcus sp.]|nr:nucleotidyltransferase domain-containing protein [Ruminococcus sp.]